MIRHVTHATAPGLLPFLAVLLLLTGCPPAEPPIFSFAVIADAHVSGGPDTENAIRLAKCVDWINLHKSDTDKLIELVFTVGDMGWGSGLGTTKDILDGLTIPYVPIVGDNEVHASEDAFDTAYASQYDNVAASVDNWQKAPTPVWNPEVEDYSHFQNFSFDYAGVHFLGIDWCARNYGGGGLESEQADLHDFPGGTWPWFTADITNCGKEFGENIVMVTHHPMHVAPVLPVEAGAFSTDEDNTVETFTSGFGGNVYANLAGHYHIDWHESRTLGQYEIYVTEATKLGADNFRLVKVFSDGSGFTYKHQKVIVPLNP